MTRKTLLVFLSFLLATGINARSVGLFGHDKLDVSDTVRFAVNPFTGAIDELTVEGDKHHMNWIVKTDGSQYPWITERYSWGLGYFTQVKGHESLKKEWMRPLVVEDEGKKVLYKEGDVLIRAERSMDGGDLIEEYTFTNKGGERIWLYDIGIYTPFNDNYPNSQTCITNRCHAHVWNGGSGAYVNALRMGFEAPHVGMMLTEGAIDSYEIWGRGRKTSSSHMRGIFAMNLPDMRLNPGESYRLKWRLFSHGGKADFRDKMLDKGGVLVSSDKYVYEIGEMAFELQAKLLRVLEAGEYIKIGDTKPTKVNVRVISATNRDLKKEIEQGNFREDLYYRLSVFQIHLPPLRERKEDIELLAESFIQLFSKKLGKQVEGMAPEFLKALKAADWRGNIRELRNVIERSMIVCDKQLTLQDLPIEIQNARQEDYSGKNYSEFELAAMEKRHIAKVLQHTKGNKAEASRLLKIGLTTLYRKIEEYGI